LDDLGKIGVEGGDSGVDFRRRVGVGCAVDQVKNRCDAIDLRPQILRLGNGERAVRLDAEPAKGQ
jgi:hypothetical protein